MLEWKDGRQELPNPFEVVLCIGQCGVIDFGRVLPQRAADEKQSREHKPDLVWYDLDNERWGPVRWWARCNWPPGFMDDWEQELKE